MVDNQVAVQQKAAQRRLPPSSVGIFLAGTYWRYGEEGSILLHRRPLAL